MKKELKIAGIRSILKYGDLYKKLARRKDNEGQADNKNHFYSKERNEMKTLPFKFMTKQEREQTERLEKQEQRLERAIRDFYKLKTDWIFFINEKYGVDLEKITEVKK